MLPLPKPTVYQSSKCTATYGQMPHLSPTHTPAKHKPWTSLLSQDAAHRVDLILPEPSFLALEETLAGITPPVHYRVTAPLGVFLEGVFFADFVKTGAPLPSPRASRA